MFPSEFAKILSMDYITAALSFLAFVSGFVVIIFNFRIRVKFPDKPEPTDLWIGAAPRSFKEESEKVIEKARHRQEINKRYSFIFAIIWVASLCGIAVRVLNFLKF